MPTSTQAVLYIFSLFAQIRRCENILPALDWCDSIVVRAQQRDKNFRHHQHQWLVVRLRQPLRESMVPPSNEKCGSACKNSRPTLYNNSIQCWVGHNARNPKKIVCAYIMRIWTPLINICVVFVIVQATFYVITRKWVMRCINTTRCIFVFLWRS